MKTVKEVSRLTGISVRTLHYYDEIGLLRPTKFSYSGYRLYDDKALEILQRILFFREFEMPLKNIKTIMENPALDRNQILLSQKKMLELKKERLQRLISSIDDILKGENRMDFEVFSKKEIEELYQTMASNMTEDMKQVILQEYGEMERYHEHYVELASSEQAQKNYQKLIEWYGNKEDVMKAACNPMDEKVLQSYQKRLDQIMRKLAEKRGTDVSSFEVKAVIGECGFVYKQLYQLVDDAALMLEMASSYKNDEKMKQAMDQQYGGGTADFFAAAVEAFYRK